MAGVILVPMFASALRTREQRHVLPASADFASLPWSDGVRDHNDDRPYLSLSVLHQPFASNHFVLHPGTHITLTRSTLPWERSADGEMDGPPWLAIRLVDDSERVQAFWPFKWCRALSTSGMTFRGRPTRRPKRSLPPTVKRVDERSRHSHSNRIDHG